MRIKDLSHPISFYDNNADKMILNAGCEIPKYTPLAVLLYVEPETTKDRSLSDLTTAINIRFPAGYSDIKILSELFPQYTTAQLYDALDIINYWKSSAGSWPADMRGFSLSEILLIRDAILNYPYCLVYGSLYYYDSNTHMGYYDLGNSLEGEYQINGVWVVYRQGSSEEAVLFEYYP